MNVLLDKETKHLGNQKQIADMSGKGGRRPKAREPLELSWKEEKKNTHKNTVSPKKF